VPEGQRGVYPENQFSIILLFIIPPFYSPQRGENSYCFSKNLLNKQSITPFRDCPERSEGGSGGKKKGFGVDLLVFGNLFTHFPQNYPRTYRYIERVFCAELRNLYAQVATVYDLLIDSIDFMTKNKRIFLIFVNL
jgi:hypothetical protein